VGGFLGRYYPPLRGGATPFFWGEGSSPEDTRIGRIEPWVSVIIMGNVMLILVLLVAPFFGVAAFGVPEPLRGRIGITCVFLCTGLAHFAQGKSMTAMIPPRIAARWRLPIIYLSGAFELAAACAVLVDSWARAAGILLCLFLILVLPANIDSAIRRVPFGGHGAGPRYLVVRVPLQIVLIVWTYWFAVRPAVA